MVPPRSLAVVAPLDARCRCIHSVISPTTGSAHGPNSVEPAPARPARLRAASITAICMPKQMPKNGTLRSRAKRAAVDLALGAALAEAARHQDAVHVLELLDRVVVLEHLGFDPVAG